MQYALDTKEVIQIGGIQQYIRIRSCDLSNPVILFLHGGPGVCDRFWVIRDQSGLADCATLVCWDQRGAGLSYSKKQDYTGLSVDRMVEDAAELVTYLCERFQKEKLLIVGHSWGSLLGTLLAKKYPEHIAAYVGMGQFVEGAENETLAYQFVLDEAKTRGDKKALRDLEKIGWPESGLYKTENGLMVQRKYMGKYGGGTYGSSESTVTSILIPLLKSPEYSLFGMLKYATGAMSSLKYLWKQVVACNLHDTIKTLEMPVYLTEGRHDYNTPIPIAERWFNALKAPKKEWIWFESSAHSPIKEEPAAWQAAMRRIVGEVFA